MGGYMGTNKKLILSIGMIALLAACGRPSKMPEGESDLNSAGVTPGFDLLLEKVFAPKCLACHAGFSTQPGMLASGTVIVGNPDSSALYTKVAAGLMPKNGTPLSSDEVKAIYNWISAGAPATTSGGGSNSGPGGGGSSGPGSGGGTMPPPAGTISPTFAWIQANVLTPRCIICHRGASAPAGYDLSSYANVTAGGRVIAGNAAGSRFFQRIDNDSMPPGGPALSAEVKMAIRTWIQNGALDDAPPGGLPPGSGGTAPPPLPPLEPKFASIMANIIGPRCLACHSATNPSDGVVLQDYTRVMRQVRAGSPGSSTLYEVIEDNEMPRSGGPLSFEQKETIRQWIAAGALNN